MKHDVVGRSFNETQASMTAQSMCHCVSGVWRHSSEGSMDHWKQGLVVPQVAPACVTVADAQWLFTT